LLRLAHAQVHTLEKIDAKVTNIAFSIGSVQNSATKGIQGMQAVSNLPISAWLPPADLNGGKTAAGFSIDFLGNCWRDEAQIRRRDREKSHLSRFVAILVRISVFLR